MSMIKKDKKVVESEWIAAIAARLYKDPEEIRAVIDEFVSEVVHHVEHGRYVTVRGFGYFAPSWRKARKDTVNQTGKTLPGRYELVFSTAPKVNRAMRDSELSMIRREAEENPGKPMSWERFSRTKRGRTKEKKPFSQIKEVK